MRWLVGAVAVFAAVISSGAVENPRVVVRAKPRIAKVEGEHVLELPPAMKQALDAGAPDFRLWRERDYLPSFTGYEFSVRQAPFAVIGDFNGDHILDVALFGHGERSGSLLCLMSSGGEYRVIQVVPVDQPMAQDDRIAEASRRGERFPGGKGVEEGDDGCVAQGRPITFPGSQSPGPRARIEEGVVEESGGVRNYLSWFGPGHLESEEDDLTGKREALDLHTDAFSLSDIDHDGDLYYFYRGDFRRFPLGC